MPGKRFCPGCGLAVPGGCPRCGAPADPGFRFCPECGEPLKAGPDPSAAAHVRSIERPWRRIPDSLADKIRAGRPLPGERKRVTVLFCDLVGSTAIAEGLDPEEYRDLLDGYLERTFAEIDRYEGVVNQLAGDGLMALFGAPIAHEDEAERAVRAAIGIRESVAGLAPRRAAGPGEVLEVRIGIHTGIVVVGTVGNDLKMDYTAIGDTTNLAARLQSLAAPGAILVSEATARLVEGRFALEPVGPFRVRGRSEPVAAFEVRGALEATSAMAAAEARGLTPLVGRRQELAQLEACFERFRAGLGQIVAVVAGDGSGKSRLVYEFRNRLRQDGAALFEARCSSLSRNLPYEPWNAMLRSFVGIPSNARPEEVRRKIAAITGDDGLISEQRAPYLARIFGVRTPAIAAEPGEVTLRRILAAYDELIRNVASRRPTVMIIEDVQWMDEASREALDALLPHVSRGAIMLVLTHRPDFRLELRCDAAWTRLRLAPLGREDALRVVASCAGGEVPLPLAERILARAEGNPFYLEELTRCLVAEGVLEAGEAGVRVTRPVEDIRIPDTVQEVLEARLDRLDPAAKRVAQVAALLGRQFRRSLVEAALDDDALDVGAGLRELERQGLIHRHASVDGDEYRFGERLTREVAYEALLHRERRRLHDRVGRLLLGSDEALDATRIARIGYHLSRGEDVLAGVRALNEAAERAFALPAYAVAVRLYLEAWTLVEGALDGAEPEFRRWALRVATGLAHAARFHSASAAADLEAVAARGMEIAEELGDAAAVASLQADRGFLVMGSSRERFAEGLEMVRQAVRVAGAAGDDYERLRLSRDLAFGYLLDGRLEQARAEIESVLAALERSGEDAQASDVYMGGRFYRNVVLYESDRFTAAEEYARESHAIASRNGNQTLQSAAAAMAAMTLVLRGRYREALEWSARAERVGRQIQNLGAVRAATAARLLAGAARGQRAARREEVEEICGGFADGGPLGVHFDLFVAALLEMGEIQRAREMAEVSSERAGGRLREARAALALADVAVASRESTDVAAERAYRRALDLATAIGLRSIVARARLGLARLARVRGQLERSRAHARVAGGLFASLGLGHYSRPVEALLDAEEERARA